MDNLKSLILFWDHLAEGLQIPSKDRAVFQRRAKAEGLPFLTQVLPALGKVLDGHLTSGQTVDFSTVRFRLGDDGLPLFLNSLWRGLVGASSHEEAAAYIKSIRQLTLMYYKLEVPFDERILQEATNSFIERDASLRHSLDSFQVEAVRKIIARALCNTDPYAIIPRHGPGAVANRLRPHEKYHTFRYIPRLDSVYPYDSLFFYNASHLCDELSKLEDAVVEPNPASRLVFVPKDSRGPRLICCEPAELQYAQQGQMRLLYQHIESNPYTAGFINFTDQTINQALARRASKDASLATLDLSEASDRVSWELLQEVLPSRWCRALAATRSTHVTLPDGAVYGPLRKFAPMGSACCFPMEALLFWALIRSVTHHNVWVYGDDIIVDAGDVAAAVDILHAAGLIVNTGKSCFTTPFRESCGGEYYGGFDVAYVKYRTLPNDTLSSRLHDVSFAEQIAQHYGLSVGLKVLDHVDAIHGVTPTSDLGPRPGVFYNPQAPVARNFVFYKARWNKSLQVLEHKINVPIRRTALKRGNPKYHWCELLRKTVTKDGMTEPGSYACPHEGSRWNFVNLCNC
jgi:hypothetical protein